jgi:hypothetical protein
MLNEKYQTAKAKLLAALAVSKKVYKEAKDAAMEKYKELLTAADALNVDTIAASEQKYAEIIDAAKKKLIEAGNTPAALKEYKKIQTKAYAVLCWETEVSVVRHYVLVKPYRDAEKAAEDANYEAWTAAHNAFYANSYDPDFIRGETAEHAAEERRLESMELALSCGRSLERLTYI